MSHSNGSAAREKRSGSINAADYYVFVVTNRSDVARGMYDEESVRSLHKWMSDHVAKVGGRIDDFEYCPIIPKLSSKSTGATAADASRSPECSKICYIAFDKTMKFYAWINRPIWMPKICGRRWKPLIRSRSSGIFRRPPKPEQ